MSHTAVPHFTLAVFAAALVLGCGGKDDAPMVPLGQAAGQGAGGPTITGEAKVALDSANILFRARAFDLALAQYERSAELVPNDVTPLMGVLMVAQATSDSGLANSALARMRRINPAAADSSAAMEHAEMIDVHSRMQPPPTPSQ